MIKKWIAFFVLTCLAALPPDADVRAAEKHEALVNCDIQSGPCSRSLAGEAVTLDIRPKPVKAMTDLTFTVTFSGAPPTGPPVIDLGMPGMNMGPNRVKLEKGPDTVYRGKGVIVRCPSGRKIWRAAVTIPSRGTVEFIFHVAY